MWPVLAQFGNYELGSYGVLLAVGVLLGLWVARHLGQRDGLEPRDVNDVGLGMMFFGYVGAVGTGAAVALAQGTNLRLSNLRDAGVVHGGLLAAVIAATYLARHFRLPLPLLLDAYGPAVALGQAIGRVGCFAAGCCFGRPSLSSFAVIFTEQRAHELGGVPLHFRLCPVQLYDAALHFALFAALFLLHKRSILIGRLFVIWCVAEGLMRIAMEGFRGDRGRGTWLGYDWLSTGTVTSTAFVILGIVSWFLLTPAATLPRPSSTEPPRP